MPYGQTLPQTTVSPEVSSWVFVCGFLTLCCIFLSLYIIVMEHLENKRVDTRTIDYRPRFTTTTPPPTLQHLHRFLSQLLLGYRCYTGVGSVYAASDPVLFA